MNYGNHNDMFIPSFEEEFAFGLDTAITGVLSAFLVIYMGILCISFALSALKYIFGSLGLYAIADRRGIRHSWLAWLPVGNIWILGNISDQYQYVVKGKIKNRRKLILGLGIALFAGYFLWLFVMLFNLAAGKELLATFLLIFGGLAILVVTIWLVVCQYMAYYDLFRSCEPDNAVLYLVLSIVFPVTLPFFVFACRKKDLGMPPRKQPVQQVVIPTVEPIVETTTEPVAEGYAQPEEFED